MLEPSGNVQVDLTRAVQEFGFGPSDDSDESDFDAGETSDWDSIGLLPSWQKLQITLRNAPYSFMTGMRREANPPDAATTNKLDAEPPSNGANGLNGLPGSIENAKIAIDENQLGAEDRRTQADTVPGTPPSHANVGGVATAVKGAVETDAARETNGINVAQIDAVADLSNFESSGENEVDGIDEADDGEDGADDDEWEEIGRFPTLNQLQLTLRNASEIFALPPTIFGHTELPVIPNIRSPSDLLAKWGGPQNGGRIGWQTFMQNFQFPSFLAEEVIEEEEELDMNDPEVLALLSDENITAEDRAICYNEEGLTGCEHYLRNCKTECSICKRFYMCQLCHDEQVASHQMDRTKTKRMICLNCQKVQPPRRTCRFCHEIMGDYYCSQCKLWNDDPDKPIYHCDKCGICRVGRGIGIDVFHCDTCGICMNLSVKDNHRCIEQAAKSNCPICLDDLFSSPKPTVFMPCGHPIHRECFTEYSKRYYRCPICAKSILNTSALFRMIDEEVRCEVLPPELANKRVNIICQDCRLKSQTKFHLAGLKCETCGSYNTSQL